MVNKQGQRTMKTNFVLEWVCLIKYAHSDQKSSAYIISKQNEWEFFSGGAKHYLSLIGNLILFYNDHGVYVEN